MATPGKITRFTIEGLKRGFPSYPSNGRMPTKFLIELNGDKRWRRVYDRFVKSGTYIPIVLDGSGYRDLTKEETKHIGYSFKTARKISEEDKSMGIITKASIQSNDDAMFTDTSKILGGSNYTWYVYNATTRFHLEFRGKEVEFAKGTVWGLRSSTSKKGVSRIVLKDALTKVMSPDAADVAALIKRSIPEKGSKGKVAKSAPASSSHIQSLQGVTSMTKTYFQNLSSIVVKNPLLEKALYTDIAAKSNWSAATAATKEPPAGALKSSQSAFKYSKDNEITHPKLEKLISKSAEYSYYYAADVIGESFPAGEKAIAKDAEWAVNYAKFVIRKRWPEGEAAIAKYPNYAYDYAENVLKGRFKAGEKAIATNPVTAMTYARYVLKGPFPEGEKAIATGKDPYYAWAYAKYGLNGPFPAGEGLMAKEAEFAQGYKAILKRTGTVEDIARFNEMAPTKKKEPVVRKDRRRVKNIANIKTAKDAYLYAAHDGKRYPELEKFIAKDPEYAYLYACYVIRGRWPEGEKAIATDGKQAFNYAKDVLKGRFKAGEKAIYSNTLATGWYQKLLAGKFRGLPNPKK